MNIKLLKKVRKRFEIIRINKLKPHSRDFLLKAKEKFGLPFYYVIDHNDSDNNSINQHYNVARKFILDIIRAEFNRTNPSLYPKKAEKVWPPNYKEVNRRIKIQENLFNDAHHKRTIKLLNKS